MASKTALWAITGIVTGGASWMPNAVAWTITSFGRFGSSDDSAAKYEAKHAVEGIKKTGNEKHEETKVVISAIAHSLRQNVITQAVTHTVLAGAFVADLFGYAAKAAVTPVVALKGDKAVSALWKNGKRQFVLTNSYRDLLWRGGFIMPSDNGISHIRNNSALRGHSSTANLVV